MRSLRELQSEMAREIFREAEGQASTVIRANGLSGARRLQIYRNNMFTSLSDALRAVYPVIERLVGEQFFPYAASQYIQQHSSTSGNLHDFGAAFPAFLKTFEATAALAYLPDVAALEWAYHRVYHAAEHPGIDLAALRKVPETHYEALKFRLHPACRLLTSSYPILKIWQVNQDDYSGDQTVDLNEGASHLLLSRCQFDIEIEPLTVGEFALLNALAKDRDFATACTQTLEAHPEFDVAGAFQAHVARGTLVDFFL